jgi:ATP-binding cassette subfamily F protein 3
MLTAHHLSKSFELHTLFENVSFSLNPGERIGLVGPNGCGKTTLMRILAGTELPTSGHIDRDPHVRIGYLPQGFEPDPLLTLAETINSHVGTIDVLENDLSQAAELLSRHPSDLTLQSAYDNLLNRMQLVDEGQTAHVLAGLGLDDIDPLLPVGRLSGGQKTRISLALLLLDSSNLLLLDEPTNHLDIAMLEWLEHWLINSPCGTLIISHDRTFLDHTVDRILEMDPSTHSVREYSGNYSSYLEQHEAEIEQQWNAYHDQQAEIKRIHQDIIRTREYALHAERQASSVRIGGEIMKQKGAKDYQRSIAKKVARTAKSRQKKLERYLDSGERVEKPRETRNMKLVFNPVSPSGHPAIELERLSVGYPGVVPLITEISLGLRAGQRVVLTGKNGSGKTTLLRTITGEIPSLSGKIRISPATRLGYLSQDQSDLLPGDTPVKMMLEYLPNETEARSFLAYYLFTGDEPLKPISMLSYGQRTRLMLARLVAKGCNCLLLDEPINHLDIPSRGQFEQALSHFNGAVLAVVHDRYFIQRFAQEIWLVEGGRINRTWELS